ncbi:Uncharacterized protein TCM_005326 [Theobroma cacao]|uniref:Uncharacterized protein n=1 Tax=Theobroma cacao TaxID=3641 RepID=A0A061DV52_THECC|nr:Uncharacterized protein TCM_005326 [Theobroma cacao]
MITTMINGKDAELIEDDEDRLGRTLGMFVAWHGAPHSYKPPGCVAHLTRLAAHGYALYVRSPLSLGCAVCGPCIRLPIGLAHGSCKLLMSRPISARLMCSQPLPARL